MKITKTGDFYVGELTDIKLSEAEIKRLLKLSNEDTEEEILDMIAEAEKIAYPKALFGVFQVESSKTVKVHGVEIDSPFVAEKLKGKHRCFPYIITCGTELNDWSTGYSDDPLAEYWADQIKIVYLDKMFKEYYTYVKLEYQIEKYLAAVNPGSLAAWPITGEELQFNILGGNDFIKKTIGVYYAESFLMIPSKSMSGIQFLSEEHYENCMYCPLDDCPNRRAKRIQ